MHRQNFCKPNASLNGLGISCQFFAKFRLQRSVLDAGGKPGMNYLTIGFAFVFDVREGFGMLIIESQAEPIAFMLNGDTSSLIVNNNHVWIHLSGFTNEWEWSFLSYHFIDEGVHENASHAMLILVTEQVGDGSRVNGFAVLHYGTQL